MKSLEIRCIIAGDVHELYDIDESQKENAMGRFAWMIPYNVDLEDHGIPPVDSERSLHWYWCAIGRIVDGDFVEAKWFYDVRD